MKVAVYSAVTGSASLSDGPHDCAGEDFILFSDRAIAGSGWEVRPAPQIFVDPRRNSRLPKLLAHQYLPDYDYSLWIDSTCRLLVSARDLVTDYLGEADIAFFRHTSRDCIYQEAVACTKLWLDDASVIATQMERYERAGYPRHNGLNHGTVILRRHNERVERFNNAWWSEYCRHSCRDQLSLNYVLHKLGVKTTVLSIFEHPGLVWYERW